MELEELKKAQAELEELNALAEARAEAEADMRLFRKMQAEYQPVKPLEVEPVRNHDLEEISDELKQLTQYLAEYHSEYRENREADIRKADKDKNHSFRQNLFVAALTNALSFFFEHIQGIVEFILKFFRSLG